MVWILHHIHCKHTSTHQIWHKEYDARMWGNQGRACLIMYAKLHWKPVTLELTKHNVEHDESEQFTASETSANHKPAHTPVLSMDGLCAKFRISSRERSCGERISISHPCYIKTRPPNRFVAESSQMNWTRPIWGLWGPSKFWCQIRLKTVSWGLHSISWLGVNVRCVRMWQFPSLSLLRNDANHRLTKNLVPCRFLELLWARK